MEKINPTNLSVLIVSGEFAGQEGVCLGRSTQNSELWAVSPNASNRILELQFEKDFGVIINPGQKAAAN